VTPTEAFLADAPERERTTSEIGELIMNRLKGLDTVAYIRFASVYRDFKDVREFKEELEGLLAAEWRQGEKVRTQRSELPTPAFGSFPWRSLKSVGSIRGRGPIRAGGWELAAKDWEEGRTMAETRRTR